MALFTWSNEYSVKIQSIDRQHQKLIDMVNELHEAMKAGKGSLLAPDIVGRLATYAQEHFAHEEEMMKLAEPPGSFRLAYRLRRRPSVMSRLHLRTNIRCTPPSISSMNPARLIA